MAVIVNGDLLKAQEKLICHQVNCQSVMGSGVALQIKRKYPHIFDKYVEYIKACKEQNQSPLGTVLYAPIDISDGWDGQIICNMFAQDRYGNDGKRHTSYEALKSCLDGISKMAYGIEQESGTCDIALPFMVGCGLGGGDWNVVYKLIDQMLKGFDVTLYKRD